MVAIRSGVPFALVLAACSSSTTPTQTPGSSELPERFVVVNSLDASDQTGLVVVDLDTGVGVDYSGPVTSALIPVVDLLAVAPDGRYAAIGTESATTSRGYVVDLANGAILDVPLQESTPAPSPPARGAIFEATAAFSPDGTHLAVNSWDEANEETNARLYGSDGSGGTLLNGLYPNVGITGWLPDSSGVVAIEESAAQHSQVGHYGVNLGFRLTGGADPGVVSWVDSTSIAKDGSAYAYTQAHLSNGTPVAKVVTVEVATGATRVFDPSAESVSYVKLSDDGRYAAFVAQNANANQRVYIASVDTGALTEVTVTTQTTGSYVSWFGWEPGGERLAYSGNYRLQNTHELFVTDPLGQGWTATPVPVADSRISTAVWSPLGGDIYFPRFVTGDISRLFHCDVDQQTTPEEVTGTLGVESIHEVVVSPDGAWVVAHEAGSSASARLRVFDAQDLSVSHTIDAAPFSIAPIVGPHGLEPCPTFDIVERASGEIEVAYVERDVASSVRFITVAPLDGSSAPERVWPLGPITGSERARVVLR